MNAIIDAGLSFAVIAVLTPLLLYWVWSVSRLMKLLDKEGRRPSGWWRSLGAIVMCGPVA